MVERQDDHPQNGGQNDRDAIKQQHCGRFLNRHDVKEAVGQFARAFAAKMLLVGSRESVGEVAGDADELATLDDFHYDGLQHSQHTGDRETRQQHHSQNDQRLKLRAPADHVDQGFNRERRRESQDARDEREQHDHPNVASVEVQQRDESTQWCRVFVMAGVTM